MAVKYGVLCLKHGVESKNWVGKQVVVPQPQTKKQRLSGGCPFCKADKKV
jgi:hypothetical protein